MTRRRLPEGYRYTLQRCGNCRRMVVRTALGGADLGIGGYCIECVLRLSRDCLGRYGRLPDVPEGEFLCPSCEKIRQAKDRLPPDRYGDGRVKFRMRCRPCRRSTYARTHAVEKARGRCVARRKGRRR